MKTRAKGFFEATEDMGDSKTVIDSSKPKLAPEDPIPPRLFVLPKDVSLDARIVSLTHPRSSTRCRFLLCPEKGFFEFTRVAPPKTTPRSWLLSRNILGDGGGKQLLNELLKVDILRNADLFIATAVDPLFFILPAIKPQPSAKRIEYPKQLFLSVDEYIDKMIIDSPQLEFFLRPGKLRTGLEKRLASVCDIVEAGDETMYRFNSAKLIEELIRKASRMKDNGLPASMEEKLITKALEPPMLSVLREENSLTTAEDQMAGNTNASTPVTEKDTQESMDTAASSVSVVPTAVTSVYSSDTTAAATTKAEAKFVPPRNITNAPGAPTDVADLLRLRTAMMFICINYLPKNLMTTMLKLLASPDCGIDFTPLDDHLTHLTNLRKQAQAARSAGDFSSKRSSNEDEDADIRAEKKRKLEEDEKKKKAGETRGLKQLKKANISGMKKMGDFFKKK